MTMSEQPTGPGTGATGPEEAADATATEAIAPEATATEGRSLSFMERAKLAAAQAAKAGAEVAGQAAKAGADIGSQAAKAGAEMSTKAAQSAVATVRDPATKARAQSALRKAKRGFTTALERIDPRILADVVVKATSLQERANASLQQRGSVYRIGEITIGASIPPSIQFSIERVDDPDEVMVDSQTLLAQKAATQEAGQAPMEAIVTLDGTAIDDESLDEAANEA